MSQAPCTLFWPRSGLMPQPGRPYLPTTIARFDSAMTFWVPLVCSVMPRQ